MDRNDRARRQKQNAAAARQRGKAPRGSRAAAQEYPAASQRMRPAPNNAPQRPRTPAGQTDHAPLYDQDSGRPAAPPPQRRGRKRRLYLTKKELRRRARRRRMLAMLGIVAAIAAGAALSVALLFKVTAITIKNPDGVPQAVQAAPASQAASEPQPASSDAGDDAASQPEQTPEPTEAPVQSTVNTGPYTEQQILAALGVQLGDNMFSFRLNERQAQLDLALPLLEQVRLKRRYPGTLEVYVTPAVATYCAQTAEGWLVLSRTLKVMETAAEQPAGLRVLLCDAKAAQPGTALETLALERAALAYEQAKAAAQAAASAAGAASGPSATMPPEDMVRDANRIALDELLSALEQAGLLEQATVLDVADPEEMAFLYDGRISVRLGTMNEMEYKLQLAGYILRNEDGQGCSATDAGVLDVSHILSDGSIRPTFRQGAALLPSQEKAQAAAQQAQDEAAAEDPAAQAG